MKKFDESTLNSILQKQNRGFITLKDGTYKGMFKKAVFVDELYGEWEALPVNVVYHQKNHKKRALSIKKSRTLSYEDLQQKIQNIFGDMVEIDASTYKNMKTKARFLDSKYGEWWETPNNVIYNRRLHPARAKQTVKNKKTISVEDVQSKLDNLPIKVTVDKSTYKNTRAKARFIDPEFGEWWARPSDVLRGSRHPKRAAKATSSLKKITAQEIQRRLDEDGRGITLDQSTYVDTNSKARFIDSECGDWWAKVTHVLAGSNHPNKIIKQNKLEKFVSEKLKVEWAGNKRLEGFIYKPDFVVSDNVYLNVDGLYWHSADYRDKEYHFTMRKWFEDNGFRILQFRENEIRDKWHIVEGIVNAVAGKTENKIGARKCEIIKMSASDVFNFCEQWHLKGGLMLSGYGLKYGGSVVAIIAVKKYNNVLKVERFCVKAGWSVSGGYSKLLSYALKNYNNIEVVHSWVDLRYGDGHSLEKMGFKKVKDVLSWEWTDCKNTYNRLRCRANMDDRKLSEKEYAKEFGLVKIYDAGQRLYEKKVT